MIPLPSGRSLQVVVGVIPATLTVAFAGIIALLALALGTERREYAPRARGPLRRPGCSPRRRLTAHEAPTSAEGLRTAPVWVPQVPAVPAVPISGSWLSESTSVREVLSPVVLGLGLGQPRHQGLVEQLTELHSRTPMLGQEPDGIPHLVSQPPAHLHVVPRLDLLHRGTQVI